MRKLRGITREDPTPAESIHKLQCFIGLLECETIPEVLFERAARVRNTWGPTGDLTTAESLVPEWLRPILDEEYGEHSTKTGPSRLRTTLRDMESVSSRRLVCKELSPEDIERTLFDILCTVVQSFPEPYAEILWQEYTAQLWPVVDSTCIPFLAIIDLSEVLRYISMRPK
jgi:hypothetical protein